MGSQLFVSYAQNFEDVMLWRALKHVDRGFYIDAGASFPDDDSVTRAFHDRGWRGINIEPAPRPFARLQQQRADDINVNAALSDVVGEQTFFLVGDEGGLSTMDPEIARTHDRAGMPYRQITVPVTTLAALCALHVQRPVHFLKIDVEGAELSVLQGADFTRWRPWILLLEASLPNSQTPSYAGWEPVVLAAGYRFVYFDGLNRFYVAEEHAATLAPAFATPPNVFDQFVRAREYIAHNRNSALATRLDVANRDLELAYANHAQTKADLAAVSAELDKALRNLADQHAWRATAEATHSSLTKLVQQQDARIKRILDSASWKVTAPLRFAHAMLRTCKDPAKPPGKSGKY
jgi:FkbM family methyltransferase